jgi:hypothetical protein
MNPKLISDSDLAALASKIYWMLEHGENAVPALRKLIEEKPTTEQPGTPEALSLNSFEEIEASVFEREQNTGCLMKMYERERELRKNALKIICAIVRESGGEVRIAQNYVENWGISVTEDPQNLSLVIKSKP